MARDCALDDETSIQPTMVNPGSGITMIRVIAIAAATLAISTGVAMAETGGYVYRDPLALPKINHAGSSGTTMRHDLPMRAIVNGHHVQPRRDLLDALGYSDLSPQAAEEVDRLNRQLLQENLVANRMHS
jgi:hypothetical protein